MLRYFLACFFSTSLLAAPPAVFLEQHCYDCHDAETKKGDLDLTGLTFDAQHLELLVKVHDAVERGEMPPKKKKQPAEAERVAFVAELDGRLVKMAQASSGGRAMMRRLTRSEYENALRDLLALPDLKVAEMLPADGTRHGFDKVSEALDLSHVQLGQYIAAAERALQAATATSAVPPPVVKRRLYPTESFKWHMNLKLGSAILLKDGQPDPVWPLPKEKRDLGQLGDVSAPDFAKLKQSVAILTPNLEGWLKSMTFAPMFAGKYRLRLSTWSFHWNAGKIEPAKASETARLYVHPTTLAYFEAPSLKPTVHEITPWLEMGDEVIFDPASFYWTGLQTHQRGGGANHIGPATVVDWLEVEGPLCDQWPPESHRRLYGDLPLQPLREGENAPPRIKPDQKLGYGWPKPWDLPPDARKAGPLITVRSEAPMEDAKRLLADFMPRAFRREVSDAEVAKYATLVQQRLEKKDCFEQAMQHACKAALTSTHFLFRREPAGRLDDHALATRLAFWLWNSVPDDELLRTKNLQAPETMRAQVERLLKDPRSERFVSDFVDQWLNLRDIDATDPDMALYPEFRLYLKESMLAESRAFFRELITQDLPASNIVASDFAMLNQRLAEHYGIAGVSGPEIRRVKLPPGSHRGGFLTQGAVLKVTANGTVSSPVVRGVFVTERILGQPVPPPPPGVSKVDPDTRGATTIREQMARHSSDATCAACHVKMDPPGLALESYDVIGGWREHYRSLELGQPVKWKFPDGAGVRYKSGPKVDPSGELADGQVFADFASFQKITAEKPERIARAFVTQMIAYATGAECGYADRREVERIVADTKGSQHGLRLLIHEIARSELFQNK